jgi:hypothetical protein
METGSLARLGETLKGNRAGPATALTWRVGFDMDDGTFWL